MWSTYGFATYYSSGAYRFPIRVASVDTDVDELIAAGVHVCIAAGNNSFKADVSGGDDYNNIVFASNGVTANYHRGSSPYSDDAFMVGCADATPTNATTERKVSFSTTGPGVNIYAAGHNIISCTSQTNRFGDAVYYGSSSWRQCNISGTSMASPQVAGVGATYLQTEPGLTPAQLKSKIETDSLAILNTASDLTNYEDTDDLVGGPNRFMLSRYGKTQTFSSNIKGLVVK
jgi:subtilisin family serine protease